MEGNGGGRSPKRDTPESSQRRRRTIWYQEGPGQSFRQYSPSRRMTRRCDCWRTYSYPDRVVLAIVDERQRLANRSDACYNQIRKMRAVARMQGERI